MVDNFAIKSIKSTTTYQLSSKLDTIQVAS